MAIKVQGDTVIYDDKVFQVGSANTTQRPASPANGMLLYNTDNKIIEMYANSSWQSIANANNIGDFQFFSGTPSSNWLKLDGSIVLQNSYPKLFNLYGLIPNGLDYRVSRTSGTTSTLYSVIYGNGKYVYAGVGGVLATSTDAINWTTRTSGTTSTLYRTAYLNNNLYVYGGVGGVLATSTDAISWTARTSGTTSTITAFAYGNGKYVYGAKNSVISTSTDAISWTLSNNFFNTSSDIYASITNGSFLVYGGAGGVLATSNDGLHWISRTSGTTSGISALTYGNNLYVYAGAGGVLATSTDAISWTARTSGTTSQINTLSYGNNLYVYAGDGGVLATSTDAISWTARTSGTPNALRCSVYGNGLYIVAGETTLVTSTDGVTWVGRSKGSSYPVRGIAYASDQPTNKFVTVNAGGGFSGFATSTDGISWVDGGLFGNAQIFSGLIYANGLFVAGMGYYKGGTTYYQRIKTSTNGSSWSDEITVGNGINDGYVYAISYSNNKFNTYGTGGLRTFYYQPSTIVNVNTIAINSIVYGNNLFVYGANGGVLATSTDAINWTARTSGTTSNINKVDYADNLYIYGGVCNYNESNYATSTDAINWTSSTALKQVISGTYAEYNSNNKYYVTIQDLNSVHFKQISNTSIIKSFAVNSILPNNAQDIMYNSTDKLFVTVGDGGSISTFSLYNYNASSEFVLPALPAYTNISDSKITSLSLFSIQKLSDSIPIYYKND